MRHSLKVFASVILIAANCAAIPVYGASTFSDAAFQTQWSAGEAITPNFWGPLANAKAGQQESYKEAAGGQRLVQYFDKGRMELTNGTLTNGLLATELISGDQQLGDATFVHHDPPAIAIAGDPSNTGPTYAMINGAAATTAYKYVFGLDTLLLATGKLVPFDRLASYPEVGMGAKGDPTTYYPANIFAAYRTRVGLPTIGYAIREPFWVNVTVGGTARDVLVQVFERRLLTYTPSNPDAFKVEMGNIGQHYYQWRYTGASASGPPPADPQQGIAAAERVWQQARITNYRITVMDALSGVGVITRTIVATIQNGKVIDQHLAQCTIGDHACAPDATLDPQTDISVPGLFAYARANTANPNIETTVDFDPTYGFPQAIRTALRNAVDAAGSRVVTQFEPLP